LNRATAYLQTGQTDRGIQDLSRAIVLSPTNALLIQTRGNTYSRMKDYLRAMQDYEEGVRLALATPMLRAIVVTGTSWLETMSEPWRILTLR
jgi:tetratricopeptide (TPR) repeat protein